MIEDLHIEAARTQGLGAMRDRLTAESIPHALDSAGGAPPEMYVRVPLGGGAFLAVVRGSAWNGENGQEDGWDFTRFLDEAGEDEDAFVDNVTMTEAIAAIRSARDEAATTQGLDARDARLAAEDEEDEPEKKMCEYCLERYDPKLSDAERRDRFCSREEERALAEGREPADLLPEY